MFKEGYQIRDQQAIHFITFAVVKWVDVFTRKEYSDILVESLRFCQREKGLKIHAWCIMSNHVHLIISARQPFALSDIIRDLKKYTSSQILKSIEESLGESRKNWMLWLFKSAGAKNDRNEKYQFWRQENRPVECSSKEIFSTKIKYLHENPLRAGMVREEWNYQYSSAIDYYTEGKGMLDIDFV